MIGIGRQPVRVNFLCLEWGSGLFEQILEPVQTTATGANQIEIAIAVQIDQFRIEAEAGFPSVGNEAAAKRFRFRLKTVGGNDHRVVFARVFAIVTHVAFTGDHFRFAVIVQIAQQQ